MRTSHFVFALVLLSLFSTTYASFDAIDYLYSNESASSIQSNDFSLEGKLYTIVTISGSKAFLLKEGELIENKTMIEDVIYKHYSNLYYPSESELNNINSLLQAYNDSKNDGSKIARNREDNECRYALFTDGHVKIGKDEVRCIDEESCQQNAMILFSYGSVGFGWGSPTVILEPLKNYSFASYGSEDLMKTLFERMNSTDKTQAYDNLKYVHDSIPKLRSYEKDIETSVFRYPNLDDPEDVAACTGTCYGLCPPLIFNETVLDQLETDTQKLMTKMTPFAEYKGVSSSIFSNTNSRLTFVREEANLTYYSGIYNPLAKDAAQVISFAKYTDARVTNSTLKSDLSKLEALHNSINTSLIAKNFDTIESDIDQYKLLIPKVNETATAVFTVYNDTVSAKNNADSLILILETKDVDPITAERIAKLKNRTTDLDAAFKTGLTQEKSVEFKENYSLIVNEGSAILSGIRDNPGSMIFLSFRSFARRVNSGLATFVESASLMSASEIPDNKAMTFGGFSLITFLSLGAMISFIFLTLLVTKRIFQTQLRYVLVSIFLVAILSLTAFSAFLYVYLERTSTSADIEEFLIDLNGQEDAALLLDLRGAPFGSKDSMKYCASKVADSIFAKNKSMVLYTIDTSGCSALTYNDVHNTIDTKTVDSCLSELENISSSIIFNYSSTLEKPSFSIIYTSEAHISADSSYYDSCPLEGIFG
jgi:hypothetical protein